MAHHDEPHRTAIYATALTAFFAIAGIAIVDPILPVIGHEIGASTWQIELLFTAYVAVMALGMVPATVATGRFGYKKILVAGVGVVAVAAVGAALAGGLVGLALLRGLWGLGNAMFFVTAMVLLVSLANDRGWAVELYETCLGLGFALGPLLGGLLGQISWRVPFLACGVFMVGAMVLSIVKLRDPDERPAPLRHRQVFAPFRRPAFVVLSVVVAAYNFVFFIVLGYTPIALGLDVVPLGLVFTGWGVGLAVGILVVGHRLAHRLGAVQTVGAALVVLLAALVGLATSPGTAVSVVWLVVAGLAMGVTNANVTDLALGVGDPDRRVTTGAFNLVRWGFAAPAPVVAGLLAEHVGLAAPFWVGAGVLVVGVATMLLLGHRIAAPVGERVLWRRWDAAAAEVEGTPAEAAAQL
ncbi:putative MFS family arabinose efflux permease [Isoptericola jiangsuensis]|uniref:Putative MFS family arabinose efflux permease n=1 Tax=Isoptericola jiangsuensis TaxID=548579 RepID=A0A2A9F192_9MICO|nr:MFS transporter [Isoptericola jiangsuensis]PFG44189.1 putative MFS family arabinose efflux permease [Isoptericola jiangsuensis]